MSVDLETLKLDVIGAFQLGSLTRDLVDDIIAALERAERLEGAAREQRKAEECMLSIVSVAGHGYVEARLVREWIDAGVTLDAALAPAPEGGDA